MDIIDDKTLPSGMRLGLVAYQAGEALNASRPAHIGTGPMPESESIKVLAWLKAQPHPELAVAALTAACAWIRHKWTGEELLTRAQMVYDSSMEAHGTPETATVAPDPDAKTTRTRKRASRAHTATTDTPAA